MAMTIVDRLYKDFREIISYLEKEGEISFRSNVDENFRKSLLLAAASYFEERIVEDLIDFFITNSHELGVEFIKNKAIKRQYHTFFNWDGNNANQFFSLFGTQFKTFMNTEVANDENLELGIKAFLEIGRERNRLVHQNFGAFYLEKTADEIYQLYNQALNFVNALPNKFLNSSSS